MPVDRVAGWNTDWQHGWRLNWADDLIAVSSWKWTGLVSQTVGLIQKDRESHGIECQRGFKVGIRKS